MEIDSRKLMAYMDGELDATQALTYEAELKKDPVQRALLAELRENDCLLRQAFPLGGVDDGVSVLNRKKRLFRRGEMPSYFATALAASLATFAIGAAVVYQSIDLILDRQASRVAALQLSNEQQRDRTFEEALEKEVSGVKVSWRSDETGHTGWTMPTRTWRTETGQFCREFEQALRAGDVSKKEHGVACRDPQGVWQVRIRYYPE